MKLKRNSKVRGLVGGLAALLAVGSANVSRAEDSVEVESGRPKVECGANVSSTVKAKWKADEGFLIADRPTPQGSLAVNCQTPYGNVDTSVWGSRGGVFDEVDFDVGYSNSKGPFSGRIGYANWNFILEGDSVDALIGNVNYKAPGDIDLGLKVTQMLDRPGTSLVGSVSKTIDLGKVKNTSFSVTPSFKVACLRNNFFGENECPSNYVTGLSADARVDNGKFEDFSLGAFAEGHYGQGPFENDVNFGFRLGYDF